MSNEHRATERLLLVDDNPTNLQVLFQALEDEGYELLVAQSGTEALETAKAALSIFPPSPTKQTMLDIADYALARQV